MKKNKRKFQSEKGIEIRSERHDTKEVLRNLIGEAKTEAMYSMTAYEREYAEWN